MAEYLEREEAIRILSNPITMSMCVKLDECKYKRQQRETDLELIKSLPAADVQPVKHGKWEEVHHWFEDIEYSCSVCGCYALYKELTKDQICSEYCPNCGAKMDGEA